MKGRLIKCEVIENLPNIRKIEGVTYELMMGKKKVVVSFPRRSIKRAIDLVDYMTCDEALRIVKITVNNIDCSEVLVEYIAGFIDSLIEKEVKDNNIIVIEVKEDEDLEYESGCLYFIEGVETELGVLDRLKDSL